MLVPFADPDALSARDHRPAEGRAAAARDAEEGLPDGPGDGLVAVGPPLHGSRSSGPAASGRVPDPAADRPDLGRRPDPRRTARRPPRLAARPPAPDDRFDRPAPARHLHHPQLRRGLLHRRQRPCALADRAARDLRGWNHRPPHWAPSTRRSCTTRFDPDRGRFRNFMGYDRRWLEEVGSDDSHGRALWALGACVGRSRRRDFQFWAAQTFELALPPVLEMTSPRALGVRPPGHPRVLPPAQRRPPRLPGPGNLDGPAPGTV